jgi:tetratricopeptide (TPR) repeat protein
MAELYLRAEHVQDDENVPDVTQWRWRLTDQGDAFLAGHQVALDPADPEYAGFVDLAGFLRDRVVPDRRLQSEAELVDRVGGWIGQQVLGEAVGRVLLDNSPVVVRVLLPPEAAELVYRPLELAHVDGRPLAVQDVSLVFEVRGEARGTAKQPIGERLRMLAVFSLPTGGTALALRRERYSLTQLVRRVAATHGRAIELHILQYGVTRQRLQAALEDGTGWDAMHFSGHGNLGRLVLEHPDGTGDELDTDELVGLLWPARQRLKLVCLSACLSAAGTAVEVRRSLALEVPEQLEAEAKASRVAAPLPGLARELVRRLGCAVLAMRFSVVDDFAIAFNEGLYERLLGRGQDLTRAVQLAVPAAAGERPSVGRPAISVATPALFGPLAATLRLIPPPGQPEFNVDTAKMVSFRVAGGEPKRFVGRAGVLARASMALAPQNQQQHNSVLLHGMAGAGKTACALELAYRHEQAFGALVWWKAPEQGRDITTSLRDLAVAMEAQLPGFKMVHAVASEADLRRFLPRLTQLLEDQAILVVLDNLESLLTDQGQWRDPNWGLLVAALVGHGGNSRLVLTSRVPPAGLDGRVLVEPVHALSLDESLLLARELPNLGRLLRQDGAGSRGQGGMEAGVVLVRRVLNVVQGHPELLELADAEAADLQQLGARLAEADQALPGQAGRLGAFFARGESQLAPEHFLSVLAGWTRGAAGALPERARLLFWLICAVEEADRWHPIVEANWADLWRRLGREGEPPSLDEAVAPLVARALVQAEQEGKDAPVRYRVHPGVAEAARQEAGEAFQAAVDAELAAFWRMQFTQALVAEGGEASGMVVHAGRAGAPYLLRLGEWATASRLLDQALMRDQSPATVAALLPLLGHLAQVTRGTDRELIDAGVLARAVSWVDPEAGERQLRTVLTAAVAQQDYDVAGSVGGDLVNLLRSAGRLRQALALVDDLEGYTRQAGFGPWTQLLDRGQRLQLLYRQGEHEQVLAEVQQLRDQMATLPKASDQEERANPWNVRELILQIGAFAARELGRFEVALELNGEVTRSEVARDAPALDQARSQFNDYYPLLQLGRLEEARAVLHHCREVFQAEGAIPQLGRVFVALADVEYRLGHQQDAIGMVQAALRYLYAAGELDDVAVSHSNLAISLWQAGGAPALVVAHGLAAALLYYQTGSGGLANTLRMLADQLAELGEQAVPESFEALCARVGEVEGVRLAELLAGLPGPAADGDQALAEVLRLAREQPAEPPATEAEVLEQWEPMIAAVVAAAQDDTEAATALEPLLAELDKASDWAALAGVLRRVLAGERSQQLLDGLDEVDTWVVAEVLSRLKG